MIGTYLHGPLLPKNAWLADHLIALALERRYGTRPELEPLPDELEAAAHESARRQPSLISALLALMRPKGTASGRWSRSRPRRGTDSLERRRLDRLGDARSA